MSTTQRLCRHVELELSPLRDFMVGTWGDVSMGCLTRGAENFMAAGKKNMDNSRTMMNYRTMYPEL